MSENKAIVFVVDDDPSMRRSLESLLRSVGHDVRLFASAPEFMQAARNDAPGCLVLDVRLPGMSGLAFQQELAKAGIALPIIFITGHGDVPMSVRAMKAGAAEFLTKPLMTRCCSMPYMPPSSVIARGGVTTPASQNCGFATMSSPSANGRS